MLRGGPNLGFSVGSWALLDNEKSIGVVTRMVEIAFFIFAQRLQEAHGDFCFSGRLPLVCDINTVDALAYVQGSVITMPMVRITGPPVS